MADLTRTPSRRSTHRRRRPPRALSLVTAVPEERTAAAMDDTAAADELMDDLLALIDAGLIAPVNHEGRIHYTPTDPDEPAA